MNDLSVKQFLTQNKIPFKQNECLKQHTTFKIGGNADFWVTPENELQAATVFKYCNENNINLTVMGNGSNLLVSDYGVDGIVLNLGMLNKTEFIKPNRIKCGSGVLLANLCNFALQNSLSGIEFAFGIPGSVGGAVYMNAGAYGGEIKNCIASATVLSKNGEISIIDLNENDFGYRTSIFKTNGSVILSAEFVLTPSKQDIIKFTMNDFIKRRREKQPLEYPSAGSTFKRPDGYFAGNLIEQSNLKGFSIGDAQVSSKHAGFVINKGSATCSDVVNLIKYIQNTVKNNSGVNLEPEVIFIGRENK